MSPKTRRFSLLAGLAGLAALGSTCTQRASRTETAPNTPLPPDDVPSATKAPATDEEPVIIPERDACPACGMAFCPPEGRAFLDHYVEPTANPEAKEGEGEQG